MTTTPKMTLSAAVRITGHAKATLEWWVEQGWLPTEEFIDGRNQRALVTLDDIAVARETARHAPKDRGNVWRYGGEHQPIPRPGTRQHEQMRQWVRRNRWRLMKP